MQSDRQIDEHGQPNPLVLARLRDHRLVAEMLGFARGLIADGIVNPEEVQGLRLWLRRNPDAAVQFPGNLVYERLQKIIADGKVTDDEREDLRGLLEDLAGDLDEDDTRASKLPLTQPAPKLRFKSQWYVVTGRFAFGPRKAVEDELFKRGAFLSGAVSTKTNVLLIGEFASRDWIQSSWGRKIETARNLCAQGHPIAVVAEEHWVKHL